MDEKEMLLEQYKLYVEMADRVSQRRVENNKFYITLLSTILIVLSVVIDKNVFEENVATTFIVISVLGILLSVLWFFNIKSYRQLNTGKFSIINEMERNLPYGCYSKEWKILGEGKEAKKYRQLTRIEQFIPIILAIPYLLLLLYSIAIVL